MYSSRMLSWSLDEYRCQSIPVTVSSVVKDFESSPLHVGCSRRGSVDLHLLYYTDPMPMCMVMNLVNSEVRPE